MNKLKLTTIAALIASAFMLSGCQDDARVAEYNATKAADNFEVNRRVILYNTFTDKNIMVTEGYCSVTPGSLRTSVICKIGEDSLGRSIVIRNFYGKSDNTLYFVEQMDPLPVNVYHYRRTFKPQGILPDIDFRGNAKAGQAALTPDSND